MVPTTKSEEGRMTAGSPWVWTNNWSTVPLLLLSKDRETQQSSPLSTGVKVAVMSQEQSIRVKSRSPDVELHPLAAVTMTV